MFGVCRVTGLEIDDRTGFQQVVQFCSMVRGLCVYVLSSSFPVRRVTAAYVDGWLLMPPCAKAPKEKVRHRRLPASPKARAYYVGSGDDAERAYKTTVHSGNEDTLTVSQYVPCQVSANCQAVVRWEEMGECPWGRYTVSKILYYPEVSGVPHK